MIILMLWLQYIGYQYIGTVLNITWVFGVKKHSAHIYAKKGSPVYLQLLHVSAPCEREYRFSLGTRNTNLGNCVMTSQPCHNPSKIRIARWSRSSVIKKNYWLRGVSSIISLHAWFITVDGVRSIKSILLFGRELWRARVRPGACVIAKKPIGICLHVINLANCYKIRNASERIDPIWRHLLSTKS